MDTFLIIGAVLFVAMLAITLVLRGKLKECGGMNTYALIMVAFVIAAFCVGCFYDMPETEFGIGFADWTITIATSPADGTSSEGILGRMLLTLGIGMVIGLCVAVLRYVMASKGEGEPAPAVDERTVRRQTSFRNLLPGPRGPGLLFHRRPDESGAGSSPGGGGLSGRCLETRERHNGKTHERHNGKTHERHNGKTHERHNILSIATPIILRRIAMRRYMHRTVEAEIALYMQAFGAVLVTGPKWCGKTTTSERFAKSALRLDDYIGDVRRSGFEELLPKSLLNGDRPRLIDEWQLAPAVWDLVRREVDCSDGPGQFILTGSTTVDTKSILHSGAGRIGRVKMRNMSLYESGASTGEVSLRSMFDGAKAVSGYTECDTEGIAKLLVRGGWPESAGRSDAAAMELVRGYCEAMTGDDAVWPEGHRRDPEKMRAVLRSLSRNTGTSASRNTVLADIHGSDIEMHVNTLDAYLADLRRICVIDDLRPWSPRLRSKTVVNSSPVRHLTDPAIAAYYLEATADDLLNDYETLGFLFESMAIRDLRAYMQEVGGEVLHYRDREGLEADAIVRAKDGRWGALEVKLGSAKGVEEGARNLRSLRKKVDDGLGRKLSFLGVVTSTKAAYTREDGVHVIPLACLKPRARSFRICRGAGSSGSSDSANPTRRRMRCEPLGRIRGSDSSPEGRPRNPLRGRGIPPVRSPV